MKALLHKLWPQQMVSQLMLLLVTALVLANLIAIIVIQLTGSLLHPLSRSLAVERLTVAYQATQQQTTQEISPLLASAREEGAKFWVAPQPDVARFPMRNEEQKLVTLLAGRLALPTDMPVMMQLESTDGGMARGHLFSPSRWEPLRLRTSIALADGRYLNGIQPMIQAYEWSRLLSYCLPVASVPLLLISLYCVFWVVRPVRTLARVTERFSRGEQTAPLPLTGPKEAMELTRSFNLMQERLARHIESRTRMLAAMSHDLNTPVTALRLQVELLKPGQSRSDMLESLGDLRAMVSETLDYFRGESRQEQLQLCSLTGLLEGLSRRYQYCGQSVEWPGGEEIEIHCRPVALKRALGNLIDNALNYAGEANLRLFRTQEGIVIEVLDRGPGIAEQNLSQALEPFVQLHQRPTFEPPETGGGLGLGLSIARACIHAHGGELTLENRLPAGLRAKVLLPDGIRN